MNWDEITTIKKETKRVSVDISENLEKILDRFVEEYPEHTRKSALELFCKVGALDYHNFSNKKHASTPAEESTPPHTVDD